MSGKGALRRRLEAVRHAPAPYRLDALGFKRSHVAPSAPQSFATAEVSPLL
jgi:hypothetical protein